MSNAEEPTHASLHGVVVVHQAGARGCTVALEDGRIIHAVLDFRAMHDQREGLPDCLLDWQVTVLERPEPQMARIVNVKPPSTTDQR